MVAESKGWNTGHQPVVEFHTGLLAKVWKVKELDGTLFLHDLDALEEKGAFTVSVPTKTGMKGVKLLAVSNANKKQLFTFGTVRVEKDYGRLLFEAVSSLADGKVPKPMLEEIRWRVEKLVSEFPSDSDFSSVVSFSNKLYRFIFPRLGLVMPMVFFLSDVLWTEWAMVLEESLQLFGFQEFWRKTGDGRTRLLSPEDATESLRAKTLIPKAAPLGWCVRSVGYSCVRGTGQKEYEESDPRMSEILKVTGSMTVTSRQTLPPIWKRLLVSPDFRPSALLLWLLGGQFDPEQVIVTD